MKAKNTATVYAILAAALYAINVPLSKILLNYAEPTMMAAFLYLGAGLGLFLYGLVEKHRHGDMVHTHEHTHIHTHLHTHTGDSENH